MTWYKWWPEDLGKPYRSKISPERQKEISDDRRESAQEILKNTVCIDETLVWKRRRKKTGKDVHETWEGEAVGKDTKLTGSGVRKIRKSIKSRSWGIVSGSNSVIGVKNSGLTREESPVIWKRR